MYKVLIPSRVREKKGVRNQKNHTISGSRNPRAALGLFRHVAALRRRRGQFVRPIKQHTEHSRAERPNHG